MTDLNSPENPNSPDARDVRIPGVPLPLKVAVYAMGLALLLMVVLVANRFMDRRAQSATSGTAEGVPWVINLGADDMDLPTSGGVKSAVLEGRILTIVVDDLSGRDHVILIDTKKGQIIGKVSTELLEDTIPVPQR